MSSNSAVLFSLFQQAYTAYTHIRHESYTAALIHDKSNLTNLR